MTRNGSKACSETPILRLLRNGS